MSLKNFAVSTSRAKQRFASELDQHFPGAHSPRTSRPGCSTRHTPGPCPQGAVAICHGSPRRSCGLRPLPSLAALPEYQYCWRFAYTEEPHLRHLPKIYRWLRPRPWARLRISLRLASYPWSAQVGEDREKRSVLECKARCCFRQWMTGGETSPATRSNKRATKCESEKTGCAQVGTREAEGARVSLQTKDPEPYWRKAYI